MKKIVQTLFVIITLLYFSNYSYAEKYIGDKSTKNTVHPKAEQCQPASGSTELDLNNVRARINTGGDMWWDFVSAKYEIPKGSRKTSAFTASLWIGGLDVNGQLKLAAQRYRQVGVDYWTGPLTVDGTAATDAETCTLWDKHFVMTKTEVEAFIANPGNSDYETQAIKDWPWRGDLSKLQTNYLAPFYDVNGDYVYNPDDGDYPYYDFTNSLCPTNPNNRNPDGTWKPQQITMEGQMGNGTPKVTGTRLVDQVLKGDMTLWWVFNDKGNVHTESQGAPIGLEIRAQAFSFSTNDDINNMTFYSYEIVNRSTYTLTQTYFCQWVDFDLGYAFDDYCGCDVGRGLGYQYNGKAQDGEGEYWAYDGNPPAIGLDYFQGPYMDPDGIDNPQFDTVNGQPQQICDYSIDGVNFGNGIIDDERLGMVRFVYHNNSSDVTGDPTVAVQYYNLMKAIWRDNTHMVYGGTGYYTSPGALPTVNANFMFPGDSDPLHWGTGCGPDPMPGQFWTEETAKNPYGDRRFMESSGPFTLRPGAVNYITVGVPWASAPTGGPWASVQLLLTVDDKAQALFNNCFKVLDGPDAPDLVVKELDREVILLISNSKASNNYKEQYTELDPTIPAKVVVPTIFNSATISEYGDTTIVIDSTVNVTTYYDQYYHFEGYQIYQLADNTVSVSDLQDNSKARLVAQCDIKNFDAGGNPIGTLINYTADQSLGGALVPTDMVDGANNGIQHSFIVTQDLFASGDTRLVNHQQYYFMAIAYAYNNYKTFSLIATNLDGQKEPYKAGRKSAEGEITYVIAIPHIPTPEQGGTILNAAYGSSPQIMRIEGQGNGGLTLNLTQASIDELMAKTASPYIVENPIYESGSGPINVKVVDPLNVKAGNFTLKFIPPDTLHSINYYIDSISKMKWLLTYVENGVTINDTSDVSIQVANEQILSDLGLSISVGQVGELATPITNTTTVSGNAVNTGGFIVATLTYQDSTKQWLFGVPNEAGDPDFNWIRCGSTQVGTGVTDKSTEDYYYNGFDEHGDPTKIFLDPSEQYGNILGGTWAPYRLCSVYDYGPAYSPAQDPFNIALTSNNLSNLASVDIVFTPDQSKWTRCPVIEESDDPSLASGGVQKFKLRADSSIDKDGNVDPTYDYPTGMSWFPGYAINIETGERLNIMFGEDSWQAANNGKDMMWNPTSTFSTSSDIVFGGKHYLYIMGHNDNIIYTASSPNCPAYDQGQWLYNKLSSFQFAAVYPNVMWVTLPMVYPQYVFKNPKDIPTEAKVQLRVQKPYRKYYSTADVDTTTYITPRQNYNFPMYQFNTSGLATQRNVTQAAQSALDLIGVVPNPYYAFSQYEINQIDNRVRIINLPQKCTVTIYTVNGTLIRQYSVDNEGVVSGTGVALTSIDWDLKNAAGIPIAGGVYLIYVKADGIGEKVVKWFGALRPTDLNSF